MKRIRLDEDEESVQVATLLQMNIWLFRWNLIYFIFFLYTALVPRLYTAALFNISHKMKKKIVCRISGFRLHSAKVHTLTHTSVFVFCGSFLFHFSLFVTRHNAFLNIISAEPWKNHTSRDVWRIFRESSGDSQLSIVRIRSGAVRCAMRWAMRDNDIVCVIIGKTYG